MGHARAQIEPSVSVGRNRKFSEYIGRLVGTRCAVVEESSEKYVGPSAINHITSFF